MTFLRSITYRSRRIPREYIIGGFFMALFASACVIFLLFIQIRVYSSELDQFKQTDLSRIRELEEMKNNMVNVEAKLAELRVHTSERDQIDQVDRSQIREIEEMKDQVTSLEAEVAELVESRLPHLKKLSFDQVITMDDPYVKNIVFTVTGKNGRKLYEYKVVIENSGLETTDPKVSLIFFDRLGIQIGRSDIGSDLSGNDAILLEPGEIRSYYNKIQFPASSIPHYFLIGMASPE